MIKLVILDIDGVLTNGRKLYDLQSNVIGKEFNDKDFTAIKRFKSLDIKVCFLSGDTNVNEQMAKNRKIDFFFSRADNKLSKAGFVDVFKIRYGVQEEEMVYIGDDDFDIDIIDKLKYTFCPSDASTLIRGSVHQILGCPGGGGVVECLYYVLENAGLIARLESKKLLEKMRLLDEHETL